jgi:hypothetical protein
LLKSGRLSFLSNHYSGSGGNKVYSIQ